MSGFRLPASLSKLPVSKISSAWTSKEKLHTSKRLPSTERRWTSLTSNRRFAKRSLSVQINGASKAGMPSRSEGWGGLFNDEQYRLIKERFAGICRVAAHLSTDHPGASRLPLLAKEGNRAIPNLLPGLRVSDRSTGVFFMFRYYRDLP